MLPMSKHIVLVVLSNAFLLLYMHTLFFQLTHHEQQSSSIRTQVVTKPCPTQDSARSNAQSVAATQSQASSSSLQTKDTNPTDVVYGMAEGLPLNRVYAFIRSLRSVSNCDIVILMKTIEPDMKKLFEAFRVTAHMYTDETIPKAKTFHPSSTRWLLIHQIMNKPGVKYDRVLFCDVRDTVFQSNPFTVVSEDGFYAFLESKEGVAIKECGWNSKWVSDCFGMEVLNEIGTNTISCSGTSLATWEAGKAYVKLMHDELLNNKFNCERNGVDQGMHNVFVWKKLVPNLHIITNEEGPVCTVQSMRAVERDQWGRVINQKRQVYAIVHQYDRSPRLTAQIDQQYVIVPQNLRIGK